jgi:CheY-like chemotaxis protein/nitrogen-specific signal transduction histidine kinase/HPt (histidine-containing phosphotransfer) domain-containing protein
VAKTDRRLAELEKARADAEAANRAKSDFLAVMSHEIRTPMNAILGAADLALEGAESTDQRELLETLKSNAEGLLHLINEILDFSKIEAGQMAFATDPCFIYDVVESVAHASSTRAHQKGLHLLSDLSNEIPVMMIGDGQRLRQVLTNLVSNAVKFTAHGSVVVRAEVERDLESALKIHFTVTDSGMGIPPDQLDAVFDRFYQIDGTTRRQQGGTGLGLSICRSLASLMGGRVWADSVEGAGSTFHLVLPFAKTLEKAPSRRRSDVGFPGRPAAVVGTDANAVRIVAHVLRSLKLEVRELADAAALETLIASGGLQRGVVVLDVSLGREALVRCADAVRAMRAGSQPEGEAPVQFIAARPISADRVIAEAVRDVTLLSKPLLRRKSGDVIGAALGIEPPSFSMRPHEPVEHKNASVLLVEDNPANRLLAITILQKAGYDVDFAENGVDGLAKVAATRYDLIISDLEMPRMDGLEMTRMIRTTEATDEASPVPIVAFTAHAVEGIRVQCMDAGMNDYITKPIAREKLLTTVSKWADVRPVILVVDDAADNRMVLRRYLSGAQFRHVEASSGDEALKKLAAGRVSLILLDMRMPGLSGPETAALIRAMPGGAEVPIIAFTASDAGGEEERLARQAGCDAFLTKPVSREKLIEAIVRQLKLPAPEASTVRVASAPLGETVVVDDEIADYVPQYLQVRRNDAIQLHSLVAWSDFEAIRTLGHNLKGTGGSFGFPELTNIGAEIEAAAGKADSGQLARLANRLERYVLSVRWTRKAPE